MLTIEYMSSHDERFFASFFCLKLLHYILKKKSSKIIKEEN